MTTAIFSHRDCHQHVTPPGHPECAERLEAVERALSPLPVERHQSPVADDTEILRCHPAAYLAKVRRAVPTDGFTALDGDTILSPGSLTAALRAVGGITAAVDSVMAGQAQNAFVAARPPGHHAETATAMGFCLFGTIAIAAKRLLDHHGLQRVAIIDFDVHHGNGTQDLLWDEPRILFASTHQMPLYPGTGSATETGAHGNILNHPLRPGTGSAAMRAAYDTRILPALDAYAPEFLLISAGFDAHESDPLASLDWQTGDYAWLTRRLCDIADRHAHGRIVSTLEGGYDLPALQASVAAHVGVLEERGR